MRHSLLFLLLVICSSNFLHASPDADASHGKTSVKEKDDDKDTHKKHHHADEHTAHKSKPDNEADAQPEDNDENSIPMMLYPESTGIKPAQSMKRNVTADSMNITTVAVDTDDDELYDDDLKNMTNSTEIKKDGPEKWKCNKSVDLLFLLDSSESVKFKNWELIKEFVKDLCRRFQVSSSRFGIIRYASEAEVALPLRKFDDESSRDMAIDDIFYKTGGTRTDVALQKASEVLLAKDQRSQVLILVTDGPTNRLEIKKNQFVEGKDLVEGPADILKERGVAMFAIGVEPDSETPDEVEIMKEEMRRIASEPTKQHIFLSDGYRELERKVEAISKAACVVNGGWSSWSEFSPCSVTCGYGTKVRMRSCTNPTPENNGADCTGTRVETADCDMGSCSHPVSAPLSQAKPLIMKFISSQNNAVSTGNSANNTMTPVEACFEGMQEVNVTDDGYVASSACSKDTGDPDIRKEHTPHNGRLNNQLNAGAWCAERNFSQQGDKNQYLQLDLGKKMAISAVATQGAHDSDNWVKRYHLRYSDDGVSWEYYKNGPLIANKDRDTQKRHVLTPAISARFFQFNPQEWNTDGGNEMHDMCMRAGVFTCRDAPGSKRGLILKEAVVKPDGREEIVSKNDMANPNKRDKLDLIEGPNIQKKMYINPPTPMMSSLSFTAIVERRRRNMPSLSDLERKSSQINKRILHKLRKVSKQVLKHIRRN